MKDTLSALLFMTLLYTPFTQGESHLVCKTMGEIFASSENVTGRLQRGMQGATGKRGPQGHKGDKGGIGQKGSKGEEGIVDYDRINITVQESMQHLVTRIERLETMAGCPIPIEGSCFTPLTDKKYNFEEARSACSQRSSKLADITSKVTFDFIMSNIRTNFLSGSSYMDFWLGMTITPTNSKVVLSDGTDAQYLRWYPGYPKKNSDRTGMILRVQSDSASRNQYFFNYMPTYGAYIICQF